VYTLNYQSHTFVVEARIDLTRIGKATRIDSKNRWMYEYKVTIAILPR
jgi:hypothetical protein